MTSIILQADTLDRLKGHARRQLPDVKHSHLLEALARALHFNTWAALGTYLDENPGLQIPLQAETLRNPKPHTFARRRLLERNHHHLLEALARALCFNTGAALVAYLDENQVLQVPFLSRCFVPVSLSGLRERLVELAYPQALEWSLSFADLENGKDIVADSETPGWDASRDPVVLQQFFKNLGIEQPARGLLVNMAAARDPRSDRHPGIQSTMQLTWKISGADDLSKEDQEALVDAVVRPALDSLISQSIEFREKTVNGTELVHSIRPVMTVTYGEGPDFRYEFTPSLQAQLAALVAMSNTEAP